MNKCYLILLLSISSFADSLSLHYNLPISKTQESIITAINKCNFNYKTDTDEIYIESRYTGWRANLKMVSKDSSTTNLLITSFYEYGEKTHNHKLFKELIAEAVDQEIQGKKSIYSSYHFKAKNKLTYQSLTIVSPSFGIFYLANTPVHPCWQKWVTSTMLLGIDVLSIRCIINPDVDLLYRKNPNRKPNNYGYYIGIPMLIGMRALLMLGADDIFEYQTDLEKSGYGFTHWKSK